MDMQLREMQERKRKRRHELRDGYIGGETMVDFAIWTAVEAVRILISGSKEKGHTRMKWEIQRLAISCREF